MANRAYFAELIGPNLAQNLGKSTIPSGYVKIAIEHGPFSSLIYLLKMVIFHSFLYVYQRV